MQAMRLPKKTDKEKATHQNALENAFMEATRVPLGVLERCLKAAQLAHRVVQKGNWNSVSDGAVASLAVKTAAEGAYFNIRINLPGIQNRAFKTATLSEAKKLLNRVMKQIDETLVLFEKIIRDFGDSTEPKKAISKRKESRS
jgi:glutamate formiminotransferase/formiminotetrahydrofolate cyclodeaminase